jgi:hypothetical protein
MLLKLAIRYGPMTPIEAGSPQLPLVHCKTISTTRATGCSKIPSKPPHSVAMAHRLVCTGWTRFHNPVQSVWQRCSCAMSPHRFGHPRRRYSHHSRVTSVLEKPLVLCKLKEREMRIECRCSINYMYLLICVVRKMKTRLGEV